MSEARPLSLFDAVKTTLSAQVEPIYCTKTTLVHISHALEDVVLKHRLPALMFTGFQKSSHWREETERYRQLATIAHQICIFAGEPLPDDSPADVLQITLKGEDPLRQEWFLVILSASFSALLTGKDQAQPVTVEGLRRFETIFSLDPDHIILALDRVGEVLDYYRPQQADELRAARARFPPASQDIHLINLLMTEMIQFEEGLHRRLRDSLEGQMRANTELALERDYQQLLIETLPVFQLTLTPQGRIIGMNPTLRDALGLGDDIPINVDFIQTYIAPEDQVLCRDGLKRANEDRAIPVMETSLRLADGQLIPVEWRCSPIKDNDGQPAFVLAVGSDLTLRKRIEKLQREDDRLRIYLQQERKLNALRARFLATMSHEFRTPLAVILSSTQMLTHYFDRLTPDVRHKRLERITEQVQHLNEMMGELSTMAETNALHMTYEPQTVDLLDLVAELIDSVTIVMKSLDRIEFTHNWQRPSVQADPRLLRHILTNLLSNALKYTPPPTPIRLHLADEGDHMVFTVTDHGIGILESDQKQIFEAFYRGQNVGERVGTGVGLKIAADSVAAYGGSINFTSEVGRGTTFTVTLPC